MKAFYSLLVVISASILIFSCTKENVPDPDKGNDTHPEDTVKTGGSCCDTCLTDVYYSQWISVPVSSYQDDFSASTAHYDMPAPIITQAVMDSAVVLMYAKHFTEGFVMQLPYVFNYREPGRVIEEQFAVKVGYIQMEVTNVTGNPIGYWNDQEIRYIIIPGNKAFTGRQKQIDYKNYEEVTRTYNIPE